MNNLISDEPVYWSASDLEEVNCCPVCEEASASLLYNSLTDILFGVPGTWTLHACMECQLAYLSPRPTREAIGRAYATYYTHNPGPVYMEGSSAQRLVRRIKLSLENGYVNTVYNVRMKPAFGIGHLLLPLLPARKAAADQRVRLLRLPRSGARLLDVGCGNGEFLMMMRDQGWNVTGFDLDPKAVEQCRDAGIEAHVGTLESIDLEDNSFDAITLCHVIEHLHAPVEALKICHRLLKPGGQFYLETPNICSMGHSRYKEAWRGLEPPRHLAIFSPKALRMACEKAGFAVQKFEAMPGWFFMNMQSRTIRDKMDRGAQSAFQPVSNEVKVQWKKEELYSLRHPEEADIVMLLAARSA